MTKTEAHAKNLVAIGLARGTLVHLAPAGQPTTLCGRFHDVNPRYIQPGTIAESEIDPTCRKCITAAS